MDNWSESYPLITTWQKLRLIGAVGRGQQYVYVDQTDTTYATSNGRVSAADGWTYMKWGVAKDCRAIPDTSGYRLSLVGTPFRVDPQEPAQPLFIQGVLCCVVLCCVVLCCAVLCCAVLCCAVLCCAVLCCAVLCCAVLCCESTLNTVYPSLRIMLIYPPYVRSGGLFHPLSDTIARAFFPGLPLNPHSRLNRSPLALVFVDASGNLHTPVSIA